MAFYCFLLHQGWEMLDESEYSQRYDVVTVTKDAV